MINEGELTGDLRGDFTEFRVLQNGEFIDIPSLLASNTSGFNDIQNGGGLAVSISNGVATITNTAQGQVGPPGNHGIQGQQGPRGEKGDKGDTGEKGDTGDKGDKGDTGEKGNKGDTGQKGDRGEKGDAGDKGDHGRQRRQS